MNAQTSVTVRAMTVANLRERLAGMPDAAPIYVETIVGGDLVADDVKLMDAVLTTDADGYALRLLPDPADDYDTRGLIDHGLAARDIVTEILDEHGDCFDGKPIHQVFGDDDDAECIDDCTGCCADEVIKRLRDLSIRPVLDPTTSPSGSAA